MTPGGRVARYGPCMASPEPLFTATGRHTLEDAIEWIADDHPLDREADHHALLVELVDVNDGSDEAERAIRRLARDLARSDLDSATVLFDTPLILSAGELRAVLDGIAAKCPDGDLSRIAPAAATAAQRRQPSTMETLGLIAGFSYQELHSRVDGLPPDPRSKWSPSQVERAFDLIDKAVRGELRSDLPETVPARAIEFLPGPGLGRAGWDMVEDFRTRGVPYEILLAQRAAGGTWLAHRNRTSGRMAPVVADKLCKELDRRGIAYLRASSVGGERTPAELGKVTGCDKQIGLAVLDGRGEAAFAVIFSTARDSGTARNNASRLRAMHRREDLPVAVVVSGPGWAARNETADLAIAFHGRLYSDRSLRPLADQIANTMELEEGRDASD